MNPNDIQIATSPDQVADLIKTSSKVSNTPQTPTSGASVDEILSQIQKDAMSKEDQAKALEQLREKSKPKPQPLHLKYVWAGNCPNGDNHQIKTLMVDNEAGYFCVCYCLTEDVQLESVKVGKLPQPKLDPKIGLTKEDLVTPKPQQKTK